MFPKLKRLFKLCELSYLLGASKPADLNRDNLKEKCAELEQNLKLAKERMHCVMNILKSNSKPKLYEFHTTDKGVPVLVSINMAQGRLKVYNINNNTEGIYTLRLDAAYRDNDAEITNIGGGIGLGHGKIALERFVHHCIMNGIENVSVRYSPPDKTHETRFIRFFTKCGFQLMKQEGNKMVMQKKLPKG